MAQQNPTPADNGDASTLDRIEAYLAAEEGNDTETTNQEDGASDTPETPDDKAATPDKPEGGEKGKTEEPQFTTSHLAQFLGVDESLIDVDDDGQPVFKTKIDGKEGAAKFSDFLKTYQLNGAAENRVREAAEKERAADRKLQEAEQAIQGRLQETQANLSNLAQINAVLQQELAGERNSINWDALWQENPAQARSLERRFEERQQRINGVFQQIQTRNAQAQQQARAMSEDNAKKAQATQQERLYKLIPEWKDQDIFAKERAELLSWIEKSGVDPEDLDLNKASQVALLRRAWQHDTLQKSKPEVENRLKTAPRLIKPGQAPQQDNNAAQLRSLKQVVRNSSGTNSTKAVAEWLMKSGKA